MMNRSMTATVIVLAAGLFATGPVRAEPPAVVRLTAVRDAYPFWSPDGKQIVFQSDRHDAMMGDRDIYVMNADGTGVRRILHRAESDETPVWSPDGKKILFASYLSEDDNELFIMNVDGTALTQLTDSRGHDGHQGFSPDGTAIIFNSERDDDGSGEETNYEIYEMKVDGSDVKRLTHFPGWDTYPSISPDGTRIVWRRVLPTGGNSESGRNSEVFVMNRNGSEPANLTRDPAFDGYPSWSPDGSKIAFASNRDGGGPGNFHIYIMDADGSNVVRVLENDAMVEDARPRYSPDGTRLLFNRQYIADESSIDVLIVELPAALCAPPR